MRFLLVIHAAIGAIAALLTYAFVATTAAQSIFLGSLVMLGNLIVLGLVWPLILRKKQVALSIGVIVFKFAILVWIISLVATSSRIETVWFAIGLATVVVSALATAIKYREK